jgi:hypothetical protein
MLLTFSYKPLTNRHAYVVPLVALLLLYLFHLV